MTGLGKTANFCFFPEPRAPLTGNLLRNESDKENGSEVIAPISRRNCSGLFSFRPSNDDPLVSLPHRASVLDYIS